MAVVDARAADRRHNDPVAGRTSQVAWWCSVMSPGSRVWIAIAGAALACAIGTGCVDSSKKASNAATPVDASSEFAARISDLGRARFHVSFRVDDSALPTPDDPGAIPIALDWYEDGTNRRFDIKLRLAPGETETFIMFVDPDGEISAGCREESDPTFVPFCGPGDSDVQDAGQLLLLSLIGGMLSPSVVLPKGASVTRRAETLGTVAATCYDVVTAGSTTPAERFCFDQGGRVARITLSPEPGQERVLIRDRIFEPPTERDFSAPYPAHTPTPSA